MRAAAGHGGEVTDLPVAPLGRLIGEGAFDLLVLGDDAPGLRLQPGQMRRYRLGQREIDARLVGGDMRADLLDAGKAAVDQLEHDLGGEMQPHQPVAPRPVDGDVHRVAGLQPVIRRQGVEDVEALLARRQHRMATDAAVIALLPAREGIENRLVQHHLVARHAGHRGVERGAVGVLPEKLARHLWSAPTASFRLRKPSRFSSAASSRRMRVTRPGPS